jgi:hypothetical protein
MRAGVGVGVGLTSRERRALRIGKELREGAPEKAPVCGSAHVNGCASSVHKCLFGSFIPRRVVSGQTSAGPCFTSSRRSFNSPGKVSHPLASLRLRRADV